MPPCGESARVTVNFHPDRLFADGLLVVEGLLRDGVYRSQFETGVTSASPTAYSGGDRWERRLFGGAYHPAGVAHRERPKYGALNLMQHPHGGAPGRTGLRHRAGAVGCERDRESRPFACPSSRALGGLGDARGDLAASQAALACSRAFRPSLSRRWGA
ncbi:DUF3626 domain-containing protein [Bacillus cereus]|nr:DUF3626 domain-containing protein [Bacillus cereus]